MSQSDPEEVIIVSRSVKDTGDDVVRARYAAHELAWNAQSETFAGTPILTLIKGVLSLTASKPRRHDRKITIYDVTSAFFHVRLQEGERHNYDCLLVGHC